MNVEVGWQNLLVVGLPSRQSPCTLQQPETLITRGALCVLTPFILRIALSDWYYYPPHFTDKETEAPGKGFECRQSGSRACAMLQFHFVQARPTARVGEIKSRKEVPAPQSPVTNEEQSRDFSLVSLSTRRLLLLARAC